MNARACAAAHRVCALAAARYSLDGIACSFKRGQRVTAGAGEEMVIRTVHSGLVALCGALPDGRRQIFALVAPGESVDSCGPLGADCWAEALSSPTVLCELDLTSRSVAVHNDSVLLNAMLLSDRERLDAARSHVLTLGRLDGIERVMAFLADMTRRLGRLERTEWRVHLPLTREDIADYLGLNAETISRILGRIKRSGLAVFNSPTELVVPDLERLEARSPIRLPRRPATLHAVEPS